MSNGKNGGGGLAGRDPVERFTEKFRVDKASGCFVWTGAKNSNGYGVFSWGGHGKVILAHRWAYEHIAGLRVPDGLVLDHSCDNRLCVNPEHLRPLTNRQNVLRGVGPTAKNAVATHCKQGHALAGTNLRVRPDGRRVCVECQRRFRREHAERSRA